MRLTRGLVASGVLASVALLLSGGSAAAASPQVVRIARHGYLDAVACPLSRQCTAVGGMGNVVTFNPRDPARHRHQVRYSARDMTSVACPSFSQCTAIDSPPHGRSRAITFNPQSPGDEPTVTQLSAPRLGGLSAPVDCPRTSQCTAVGNADAGSGLTQSVAFTFDPRKSRAPRAFVLNQPNPNDDAIAGLACKSARLCLGPADQGLLVFNPRSRREARSIAATTLQPFIAMQCPANSECFPSAGASFDPGGAIPVGAYSFSQDVACPELTLCTAMGLGSVASTDYATGAASSLHLGWGNPNTAIACPTAQQCTAVGDRREVTFSPPPTS